MRVIILGSAAGGGVPQWNCRCPNCLDARHDARGRMQSSVAVSADGESWVLLNASPDLRMQCAAHHELWPRGPRGSPIASVVLTDGEIDHTLGLLLLRESATRLPVYAPDGVTALLGDEWPLYRVLSAYAGVEPTIMLAAFPKGADALIDERAESEISAVIDLISRVRNIRAEMNIKPGDRIQLMIAAKTDLQTVFQASLDQIARLTRAAQVSIDGNVEMPKASARAVLAGGAEVAVPLEGLIDFEQERARLWREQEKLQQEAAKLEAQLGNSDFVARAPAEKVAELRARIVDIAQRTTALDQMLEALA